MDLGGGSLSTKAMDLRNSDLKGRHLITNNLLSSSLLTSQPSGFSSTHSSLLSASNINTPLAHYSVSLQKSSLLSPRTHPGKQPHVDLTNKLLLTTSQHGGLRTKSALGMSTSLDSRLESNDRDLLSKYKLTSCPGMTPDSSSPHDVVLTSSVTRVNYAAALVELSPKEPETGEASHLKFQHTAMEKQLHRTKTKPIRKKYNGHQKISQQRLVKTACLEKEAFPPNYIVAEPYSYENVAKQFNFTEMDLPKFLPPEKDLTIQKMKRPVHDVIAMKRTLINAVSASLIRAPDFRERSDRFRNELIQMANRVASYDPEFILKVALYTRKELNIRTTANFLLTYAANKQICRPFLKKYFCATICLPSDWIEVAEQYQTFGDKDLAPRSLPAALRRALAMKFPDFDNYQLAKYNKENAIKKRRKKMKNPEVVDFGSHLNEAVQIQNQQCVSAENQSDEQNVYLDLLQSDMMTTNFEETKIISTEEECSTTSSSDTETEEEITRQSFTLKQLIRKLHLTKPVEAIMCLIGKRYPATLDEFYQSGLPGTFDQERANKRMKLPTPETWETQLSLKGNKASTWEDLIDHKKLPYMAMLRNLRNMIKAGISEKHHTWVLQKLADPGAVIKSKQFPFRFFSAYEVLRKLEEEYEKNEEASNSALAKLTSSPLQAGRGFDRSGGRGGGKGRGRGRGKGKDYHGNLDLNQMPPVLLYDVSLLKRYKKALDSAVKIATVHNIKPISGTTFIFCNVGAEMARPCTSAKGLGKPVTVLDVAILLGLMFKYSCEECSMIIYGSSGHHEVELEKGTILNNMASVKQLTSILNSDSGKAELPNEMLTDILVDQTQIDNLIILSNGMNMLSSEGKSVTAFLKKYRCMINEELLFVSVDLGCPSFLNQIHPGHDNDIYLAGFSDQILRFVAERGDSGQLNHVENIDLAYNLEPSPKPQLDDATERKPHAGLEHPLSLFSSRPRWRTVRVFISSTFRDMHGERDLLTRYVFPELRSRAQKRFINVYEVDLRWGVTEEITQNKKSLELCLDEVSRCHFFIGILGERYGWVPDESCLPDRSEYEWIRNHHEGASVTELEMYCAALRNPDEAREHAFFYFRKTAGYRSIPSELREEFISESNEAKQRLKQLKKAVRTSGLELFDGYPWYWGGVIDNKPVTAGLNEFGTRVLENLWNGIQRQYPDEALAVDDISHETAQHEALAQSLCETFVGRKKVLKQVLNILQENVSPVVGIVGKAGSGKSALMAAVIKEYTKSKYCEGAQNIFVHFAGTVPGSGHVISMLTRLCHELIRRFDISSQVPNGYKNLVVTLKELLQQCASFCFTPLVLFLDGIELLDDGQQGCLQDWIPETIPKNVVFVLSTRESSDTHYAIQRRSDSTIVQIGLLELLERSEVIRKMLSVHKKQLDESPFNNQMKLLVSKKEANIPLYLTVACEELRVFGLYNELFSKLKSMPQTVPQLLNEVLRRLETDNGHDLVSTSLSLLFCSRNGLEESELHDLLNYWQLLGDSKFKIDDIINTKMDVNRMIPMVTFAQLLCAIQSFLQPAAKQRSQHLVISHTDVRLAIERRYMKKGGVTYITKLHLLLAGYYYKLADPDADSSWKGTCNKAFSELPYHLASAGLFRELEGVLSNLCFIYAKAELGMVTQLLEDFKGTGSNPRLMKIQQKKFLNSKWVEEYQQFVLRNAHVLKSHPSLTWQQALNEPDDTRPALDVRKLLSKPKFKTGLMVMEWTNKPDTSDPCLYTLSNLPQVVTCVAVSPDGRQVACGCLDCTVKVFNIQTGKELCTLTGHSHQITDLCFVENCKLCTASADNTLSLWNLDKHYRIAVMKGHKRRVNSVAYSPAEKQLVSVGWDCSIRIWNPKTGDSESELNEKRPINCVSYHPEGQMIATGSWDSAIRIWDTLYKKCKAVLRGHLTSVRDLSYSQSGRHIASAAIDGEIKLWSALDGSQVGTFTGHALPVNRLCFTPSGHQLVTVSDDHKIKVWSGNMGKALLTIDPYKEERMDLGAAVSVAFSHNGESMAVGYHEGHVRTYNVLTGFMIFERQYHSASVRTLHYSPDSLRLVCGSEDNTATVLAAKNGTKVVVLEGHTKPIICATYSKNYIVTTSHDFMANLYPASVTVPHVQQKKQQNVDNENGQSVKPLYKLIGHDGPVTCCSFNSSETMLVTGSRDRSLFIWNISQLKPGENSTPVKTIDECHSDWINSCIWSNTGDFIITASNDCNLKLWDLRTETCKVTFTGHQSAINQVAYKFGCVVSCDVEGTVKVWSHKGTEMTTLYGHTQRVNSCDLYVLLNVKTVKPVISSNWSTMAESETWQQQHEETKLNKKDVEINEVLVASGSDDGTVSLWRPLEGNELACYTGHTGRVLSVSSTENDTLCTSGRDFCVKIWRPITKTGQQTMADMPSHNAEVTAMCCMPDGETIFTGSRDGVVKIWQCSEDCGKPIISFSVKAHKKCIGSMTVIFVSKETAYLVTGSHDCQLTSWEFVKTKNGHLKLRNPLTVSVGSQVTGIVWIEDTDLLLVTGWSTEIAMWRLQKNGNLSLEKTIQTSHTDWIIACTAVVIDNNLMLISCGMDEKVITHNASVKQHKMQEVKEEEIQMITYSGDEHLPNEKRTANWLTCVAISKHMIWVGDVHGQVTSILGQHEKKMLHAGPLTDCVLVQDTLVTASRDLTIKLWDTNSMVQVGQYFLTSPVLCMKAVQLDNKVSLYCGDQLGRLLVFQWEV